MKKAITKNTILVSYSNLDCFPIHVYKINDKMSNEKDRSEVNGVQIMIYSLVKIEFLLDL